MKPGHVTALCCAFPLCIVAHLNRIGAGFREVLFGRTGGHALFTVELVREMQERGDVRQDAAGQWIEGPASDWNSLPARVELSRVDFSLCRFRKR